jgi:site-specific recombinase XerD
MTPHNAPGDGSGKSKPIVRSLPLSLWPAADRSAWLAACQPGARLQRGGAGSHLKLVTRSDLAQRYGYFLDFLARSHRLDPKAAAGAQVTLENVDSYVAEMKSRISSVTIYGSICKLRRTTQLIAPERDLRWLIEIERDLNFEMRPRSKRNRLVLAEVLVEAGLTLITESIANENLTELARARGVRNGLMVALLACCPIRLKNFAALEIGRSFVKVGEAWWIVLSALETKEKRADERPVPDLLTSEIDRYIDSYRPILAGRRNLSKALWLASDDGQPMAQCMVAECLTETTRSTLGVPVNPHLFRTADASTAALYGGEFPHLASALLHHTHPCVTEAHYNRATGLSAARAYAAIVRQYRNQRI